MVYNSGICKGKHSCVALPASHEGAPKHLKAPAETKRWETASTFLCMISAPVYKRVGKTDRTQVDNRPSCSQIWHTFVCVDVVNFCPLKSVYVERL